jgi:hypothetical protein
MSYFVSHKDIVIMSYVHLITIFVNDEVVATFEQIDVICGEKVLIKALICVLI